MLIYIDLAYNLTVSPFTDFVTNYPMPHRLKLINLINSPYKFFYKVQNGISPVQILQPSLRLLHCVLQFWLNIHTKNAVNVLHPSMYGPVRNQRPRRVLNALLLSVHNGGLWVGGLNITCRVLSLNMEISCQKTLMHGIQGKWIAYIIQHNVWSICSGTHQFRCVDDERAFANWIKVIITPEQVKFTTSHQIKSYAKVNNGKEKSFHTENVKITTDKLKMHSPFRFVAVQRTTIPIFKAKIAR